MNTRSLHATYASTTAAAITAVALVGLLFSLKASAMNVGVPTPIHDAGFGIPEIIDAPEPVEAPKELELDIADMTNVTVSWTPAVFSIAPVRETYHVVLTQKLTGAVVDDQTTNNTSVTIEGLDPNTAYVVSVTRVRGEMVSEPLELTVRTTPAAPQPLSASVKRRRVLRDVISNKPLNGFGGATGSRYEAVLKWDASEGTVRYYEVLIYRKGSDEVERTVQSRDTVARIAGLKEGRTYQYQVVAHFNDEYSSAPSKRMNFEVSTETASAPQRLHPFDGSISTTGPKLP